jgi:hypothetical protein
VRYITTPLVPTLHSVKRMNDKWIIYVIWKGSVWKWSWSNQGTTQEFASKNLGTARYTAVRRADIPAKVRTHHLRNTSQQRYRCATPVRFVNVKIISFPHDVTRIEYQRQKSCYITSLFYTEQRWKSPPVVSLRLTYRETYHKLPHWNWQLIGLLSFLAQRNFTHMCHSCIEFT